MSRPIVFLGPSLPLAGARALLDADYRSPIRRDDLVDVGPGAVVGILDGVFDQDLAISPGEIQDALDRGVFVAGASSMGALRAAEVPGMVGVGSVFAMVRDGRIERDDEVALVFDPDGGRALTEPLVNVRFAVDRLVRAGTLDAGHGRRIVGAAARLHFKDRTWSHILTSAGVEEPERRRQLAGLLRSFDLKRDDAITLLEQLPTLARSARRAPGKVESGEGAAGADVEPVVVPGMPEPDASDPEGPVLVWETGDRVAYADLLRFLALTGALSAHLGRALLRFVLEGNTLDPPDAPPADEEVQALFDRAQHAWGWIAGEEADVTLRDLGLPLAVLESRLREEVAARGVMRRLLEEGGPELAEALRAELFMDGLALKRAVLRAGSLAWLAGRAARLGPVRDDERDEARRVLAAKLDLGEWTDVHEAAGQLGQPPEAVDAFADTLALARRAARKLLRARRGGAPWPARLPGAPAAEGPRLVVGPCPKAPGDKRFHLPLAEAERHARRLRRAVGISRVALVTQLDRLGVHVAQAYRPGSKWSATFGSGKAMSAAGARVGSVLEELEKYAQDQYPRPGGTPERRGSWRALRAEGAIDPAQLDLPWDSTWSERRPITWHAAYDVLSDAPAWVPAGALVAERVADDPWYSARRGSKVFSTNGLASGFSLEEALLHATCEVIERHAAHLAERVTTNPGGLGLPPFPAVRLSTAPASTRRIVRRMRAAGFGVRVLDITSEVAVPTYAAWMHEDLFGGQWREMAGIYEGFATHPDPEVALNMALLEAAQTRVGNVAGAREDFHVHARSLGRHERPRAWPPGTIAWRFGPDAVEEDFDARVGFVSDDIGAEVRWVADRLRAAGVPHLLVADLTLPELAPARVVRVLLPGLESPSPFHLGARGRALLLHDLLPRG